MRTTLTLDADVEALVKKAMKQRGISFKEAVNSAVRAGLTSASQHRTFAQKSFSLGREQNFRWDKALATAVALEDEELVHKLSLRK